MGENCDALRVVSHLLNNAPFVGCSQSVVALLVIDIFTPTDRQFFEAQRLFNYLSYEHRKNNELLSC